MIRFAAIGLALMLGACGVPAAVVWTTVGAGLGFGAAALTVTGDIIVAGEKAPAAPPAPAP